MKNLIKKILPIAFLITASTPVIFTLFFLIKQQAIRHSMKEKLELEYLHTITVPADNVYWVKFKKEISIQNKLFDVKSYSIENNQYVFTGLFDEDETVLNNYFENSIDHKNENGNQVLVKLFQWLQSAFPNNNTDLALTNVAESNYDHLTLQHIPFPIISILTPPPQA